MQNFSLLSPQGGSEFWRSGENLKKLRNAKSPSLQAAKEIHVGLPLEGFCNCLMVLKLLQ